MPPPWPPPPPGPALDAALAAPAAAAAAPRRPASPPTRSRTCCAGPPSARPRPSLAEAARLGVAGWLDRQLDPATIDDAACDALLARLPLAGADIATVRAKLPVHSYEAFGQLGRAAVARAIWSNRQLFEVTVDVLGQPPARRRAVRAASGTAAPTTTAR